MIKKTTLIFFLTLIVTTIVNCQSVGQKYSSTSMDFNLNSFYGKWITDGKIYPSTVVRFDRNNSFNLKNGLNGVFTIQKDSIQMIREGHVYKGRLLEQTDDRLQILWDDRQVTIYYKSIIVKADSLVKN